jgi:transcription factor SFP1
LEDRLHGTLHNNTAKTAGSTIPRFDDLGPSQKLDPSETPPPLHYSPTISDTGRGSTAECTPVSTPIGFDPHPRRLEKDRYLSLSWHRKPADYSSIYSDSAVLEPDFEDSTFLLFPHSPPERVLNDKMGGPASPIDITTPTRNASSSPPHNMKTSNLTSALQYGGVLHGDNQPSLAMNISSTGSNGFSSSPGAGRHDSFSGGMSGLSSHWTAGARPISVKNPNKEKPRRESIAGSLVGGMSWGGVSVGSWIRDEYDCPLFLHEILYTKRVLCCALHIP